MAPVATTPAPPINNTMRLIVVSFALLLLPTVHGAGKRSQRGDRDLYCERDNCYDLLNVDKTATKSEIKRAFRQISKIHHPDKKSKDPEESSRIFTAAANAYEVLTNDKTRENYDYYVEHPNEHATNQFAYYAQAAQKISVVPVLTLLVGVLTVIKYLSQQFTYDSAVTNWKGNENVKVRARREALIALGKPKKSKGRGGHQKEEIQIAGEKWMDDQIANGKIQEFPTRPSWKSLFVVQLVKSPYTLYEKCVWYNGFRR